MPAKETIRVRPQRELDEFNDPIGPAPAWRLVPGATVVPRNSQEDDRRGQVGISGFMIALPSKLTDSLGQPIVLADTDEFEIRGETYQVDGAIGDYGRKQIFYTMRPN